MSAEHCHLPLGCWLEAAMRSFVDAADIAVMAVFLAPPSARFVSGHVIAGEGFTVTFDP